MSDAVVNPPTRVASGVPSELVSSAHPDGSKSQSLLKASRTRLVSIRAWVYDHAIVDRVVAMLLAPAVAILLAVIWPISLICHGRPFLYGAKRMKSPTREFSLWKVRTMRADNGAALTVLGGDQFARVTLLGRILRRTRLDEVPQVFNILAGDVRFIGPRPPLRKYVDAYPDIYAQVLASKPGITGLATVMLHKRERRLLEACASAIETDEVYRRACVPIKARLDILYLRRRSLSLDAFVIYRTFAGLLPGKADTKRKVKAQGMVARPPAQPDATSLSHSEGDRIANKAA